VGFTGVDSYSWAIFLVEFEEVRCASAIERVDVVVKLIPRGWLVVVVVCGNQRVGSYQNVSAATWKSNDRTEVKTVDSPIVGVNC